MTVHRHTWIFVDSLMRRYHCSGCRAIGCRKGSRIVSYICQAELAGRKHCGDDATVVNSQRTQNRCAEHATRVTTAAAI